MEEKMKSKYGLMTAISMVVGVVIGSGIFFKASKVLNLTGGSMLKTLLVVGVIGLAMLICALVFSSLAMVHGKVNGIVDYAEVAVGPRYAYLVAWFLTTMYYPVLTGTLAWVSAQYTCALFGIAPVSTAHISIGAMYLIAIYVLNALSPKLSGKFQISTTVIKLVPLVLMAIVGTIAGIKNGLTVTAFTETSRQVASSVGGTGFMAAVVAFAFSYEGWICATSINAELKDPKKNLPRALALGSVIVVAVYLLYFVGLSGAMSVSDMIAAGDNLPGIAFTNVFGSFVGSIIYVFIVISCLGTTNGLMMSSTRGAYAISVRNRGINPKLINVVDPVSNTPSNSAVIGLLMSGIWYFYWQFCFIQGAELGIPALINWEPDELPIIMLYASYIPIFVNTMRKETSFGVVRRYVMPALAVCACLFMVYCAISAYGIQCLYFLFVCAVVMLIGVAFMKEKKD